MPLLLLPLPRESCLLVAAAPLWLYSPLVPAAAEEAEDDEVSSTSVLGVVKGMSTPASALSSVLAGVAAVSTKACDSVTPSEGLR